MTTLVRMATIEQRDDGQYWLAASAEERVPVMLSTPAGPYATRDEAEDARPDYERDCRKTRRMMGI